MKCHVTWSHVVVYSCMYIFSTTAGSAQTPFTEEAIERGIDYPVDKVAAQFGGGVGLFDIDGDGDPDAVITGRADGKVGIYENDGTGHFIDRSGNGPTPSIPPSIDYSGISAVDYDADGDLDIYLSRYNAPNGLFRNEGGWRFTDVSKASGADDDGASLASCWGDCNGDGWPDVYVSNRTGTLNNFAENRFYENQGDGTFIEKAGMLGIDSPGDPTLVAAFLDYDDDGDPDLYLGTDKGTLPKYSNHLFENVGTGFVEVTEQTGTEANVDCMGIAVGDIDRNGAPDIYLSNTPAAGNLLLMNNGAGVFEDRTSEAGAGVFRIGWGVLAFDYDNNGWEDLYICNMMGDNVLLANPGSFPMIDISAAAGVDTTGTSYNAATGDIDGDGDLDLLVAQSFGRAMLYINNEGSNRNWLMFDVIGEGANTHAIGARVRVLLPGSPVQTREVRAGHHFKAMDPTTLHFGMGDLADKPKIDVRWPTTSSRRVLRNYPLNRRWTLYPPGRIGDIDLDGDVDMEDRRAIIERYRTNGAPEQVSPGIEMLDADGDGDFDIEDIRIIGLPASAYADD